jgi:sporadic carbohydrate cluster protein (TIGR04323 family)
MAERKGYRGYIGSRSYFGERVAQHVQNLVIRDYCRQRKMYYLLSATEYVMPGSFVMLEQVVRELPRLEGIVLFSLFMLPPDSTRRRAIYEQILGAGATLHAALESVAITEAAEVAVIEDIWMVHQLLPVCCDASFLAESQ